MSEFVDEYAKLIITQYFNKPKARAEIEMKVGEYENLYTAIADFPDEFDIDLAYAITIHKSQGSEFDVVIIPLVLQHFSMLYRNLIYTALTRAKKMAIFVGTRKALSLAVNNVDNKTIYKY